MSTKTMLANDGSTTPARKELPPTVQAGATSGLPHHADLPRAASYTHMGSARYQEYVDKGMMKDTLPEEDSGGDGDLTDTTPPGTSGFNTPDDGWRTPEPNHLEVELRAPKLRAIVAELQKDPNVAIRTYPESLDDSRSSNSSSTTRYHSSSVDSAKTGSTLASTAPTTPRARSSIASNFSRKINRKSWVSSAPTTPSRSPSPLKGDQATISIDIEPRGIVTPPERAHTKRRKSLVKRKDSLKASKAQAQSWESQQSDDAQERPMSRKGTVKKSRPLSRLLRTSTSDKTAEASSDPPRGRKPVIANGEIPATYKPQRPPVPSLPKSFSTDRLPIFRATQVPQSRAAPVPRLVSSDQTASTGSILPKKKDELWTVFRTLDGEYVKFVSKSLALKANVVRTSLLPFLRNYASHPSNRTLRPEDLDRRTNILNKWWTGLIEMLHGRNNQSISGTDRPIILDGIAGIMERPEWRLPPSPFCPLNQRIKDTMKTRNQSTTSTGSSQSDFLAESVYHNTRNIFIQNLSAQMAFVVEKMSLRNASASLVTFCGKACAYAFVFVPGMADVMTRLWDLQMDVLKRVLEGNGIGKFDNMTSTAHGIVSSFPPALQGLGFLSLMKYMRKLRTPPPLPLGTNNIQWWGPWLERWTGRESDLFYVFVKHFHILASDFLPTNTSKQERMCAPGFLLVHAQMLTNLDATIHRDATPTPTDPTSPSGLSPTFDDVLADPDAVASALPLPPTNAIRLMAENRMIMLIRDFLSERAGEHPIARRVFAESFNDLLQVAAKGTSIFDHLACYTLLDFLEEALHLLIRFEKIDGSKRSLIDLDFWLVVWKKMIDSHNTMTEVRLYAFLYTVWNTLICELGFRNEVCDELVLNEAVFESRFNHWCPMVRAYYMRLLCWRVGRYDGESGAGSQYILETLLERLQTNWSHYLYLREEAARKNVIAPSTLPCNPAPSRRLLIIRTDPQVNTPSSFLSFDGLVSPKSPAEPTSMAMRRTSTISSIVDFDPRPDSSASMSSEFSIDSTRGRGIGGFFKNLVSSKSRSKSQGPVPRSRSALETSTPPPERSLSLQRSATDDIPSMTSAKSLGAAPPLPRPSVPNMSFKFSLEHMPHAKPYSVMRLVPPRLPMPAQQFLQTFSSKLVAAPSLSEPTKPVGDSARHATYCGRALAEWALILGECQNFFERRKNEGVAELKWVETPSLAVEVFRRPG